MEKQEEKANTMNVISVNPIRKQKKESRVESNRGQRKTCSDGEKKTVLSPFFLVCATRKGEEIIIKKATQQKKIIIGS